MFFLLLLVFFCLVAYGKACMLTLSLSYQSQYWIYVKKKKKKSKRKVRAQEQQPGERICTGLLNIKKENENFHIIQKSVVLLEQCFFIHELTPVIRVKTDK